ncbi:myosin-9-like [Mytilus trossulus]|uniref:myosin-9-like n=1 Tax=Mytilus trossulus TaxID=6551 RepID=UPI0030041AFA
MDQFLKTNKHFFYHQYEKRKPCCGQLHGCAIKGNMDKQIFNKVYLKNGETDTSSCLDRYVPKTVSVDNLDLSDLNFFLWNKGSLSSQERQFMQSIMLVRGHICHPPSTNIYSNTELTQMWTTLGDAIEHFAEPPRYKKMVVMQIQTLKTTRLSEVEADQILQRMENMKQEIITNSENICNHVTEEIGLVLDYQKECSKAIVHQTTVATEQVVSSSSKNILQHSTKCQESIQKTVESKTTEIQNELIAYQSTTVEKLESTEETIKNLISKDSTDFRDSHNNLLKSVQHVDQRIESSVSTVCQTIESSEMKIKQEMTNVSQVQEEWQEAIVKKLTNTDDNIENNSQTVQNQLTKQELEILDLKEKIDSLNRAQEKIIGILGNQRIQVSVYLPRENILTSNESGDRHIKLESKMNSDCFTEWNENLIITSLPTEIDLESNTDKNIPVLSRIFVEAKKKSSIILDLKITSEIFKSSKTLRSALIVLVQKILEAGEIDTDIKATITLKLNIESNLSKHEINVLIDLIRQESTSERVILSPQKEPDKTNEQTGIIEKDKMESTEKEKDTRTSTCMYCIEKDKRITEIEQDIENLYLKVCLHRSITGHHDSKAKGN